jgi:N utilization substance protein B
VEGGGVGVGGGEFAEEATRIKRESRGLARELPAKDLFDGVYEGGWGNAVVWGQIRGTQVVGLMMVHERSEARRVALQALYQMDVQGEEYLVEGVQGFIEQATEVPRVRETAYRMVKGAWGYRGTADEWLGRIAPQWPVYRMAVVDRSVLRLAIWELVNEAEVPGKVVLDEAITLGKEFSTGESGGFINGILDAVLREHLRVTGGGAGA